jgi:hypothetical protein
LLLLGLSRVWRCGVWLGIPAWTFRLLFTFCGWLLVGLGPTRTFLLLLRLCLCGRRIWLCFATRFRWLGCTFGRGLTTWTRLFRFCFWFWLSFGFRRGLWRCFTARTRCLFLRLLCLRLLGLSLFFLLALLWQFLSGWLCLCQQHLGIAGMFYRLLRRVLRRACACNGRRKCRVYCNRKRHQGENDPRQQLVLLQHYSSSPSGRLLSLVLQRAKNSLHMQAVNNA